MTFASMFSSHYYSVAAAMILFGAVIQYENNNINVQALSSFFGMPKTYPTAAFDARAGNPLTDPFERLSTVTTLTSVETGQPVTLTDQWRNNRNGGRQNFQFSQFFDRRPQQRCVVEFLRHYG